jgi:hypothetical protein
MNPSPHTNCRSLHIAIRTNPYVGAIAAQGSTALCISVAAYQPATRSTREAASLGCFFFEKIAPGCPRTRSRLLVGLWGVSSFCLRLLAAVLAAYREL